MKMLRAMAPSEAIFIQASRSCVAVGVLKRCNILLFVTFSAV